MAKPNPTPEGHRIEWMPLDELLKRRAKRNPKAHDLDAVIASIREHGYVALGILNEKTGRHVVGHGRLEALEKLRGLDGEPVPKWIRLTPGGAWLVPVIRGLSFPNERAAERYLLTDNRLTERGGWTPDLGPMLETLRKRGEESLALVGWSDREVDRMLAALGGNEARDAAAAAADEIPKEPKVAITKAGDLWTLGEHRLLCGDSTIAEHVDALLAGEACRLVVTDPPFAIYGSSTGVSSSIADDKMVRPFFEQLARMIERVIPKFGHAYVHCDWRSWASIWDTFHRTSLAVKNCIVWDKQSAGLGSMYANSHEMIAFVVRLPPTKAMKGGQETGQRQVHRPNVIRMPRVLGAERLHNAAKPVELEIELIQNSSDAGDLVLDLFGGSGSTMIAAEKCGRRARLMEIEPKNCDVIVGRWERLTGKKATRKANAVAVG